MSDTVKRSDLVEKYKLLGMAEEHREYLSRLLFPLREEGRRFYESFSDYVRRVPRAPQ